MNFKNSYIRLLQKFIKVREKTIHVEAIVRDDLWNKLKKLIGRGYVWFIITPANYDYCKCYFNLRMTKDEFTNVLIKRIKFLKEKNEEIQLHIHLCNTLAFFDKKLQDEKFLEAMNFMNDQNIKPKKFAPGWNKYNNYTLSLVKKYGIKYFYDFNQNPLKKPVIKNGIIIVYIHKVWHDYDFI